MEKLNFELTVHNFYRPFEGFLLDVKVRIFIRVYQLFHYLISFQLKDSKSGDSQCRCIKTLRDGIFGQDFEYRCYSTLSTISSEYIAIKYINILAVLYLV